MPAQEIIGPSATLPARPEAPDGPSQAELASLVILSFAVFVAVVALARNYAATVDNFGDSPAYMNLASAIRRWDFHGIVIKQFWGLPYAMAALSKLTGLSDRTALFLFSFVPSLLAVVLARRLWNGWIAGYFAVLNFDWLQRSCLGGSEPLFVCLLLASFASVRRERWLLASLLASLATIVRPLGAFALVGIGLTLLWQRDFLKFAAATAIGLAVGVLYAIPLAMHFGDPLATVNSYHSPQWQGGWLFGFPLYALFVPGLRYPRPGQISCWFRLDTPGRRCRRCDGEVHRVPRLLPCSSRRSRIPCRLSLVPFHLQLSGVGAE